MRNNISKGCFLIVFAFLLNVFIFSNAIAGLITIFETDFDSGTPSEFSGVTTTTSVQGFSGYGFSGQFLRNSTTGSNTRLTLSGLQPHTGIEINFLLAIIDSWDGETNLGGSAPIDRFNILVDGSTVFSESFDNFNTVDQSASTANTIVYGLDLGFTGATSGGLNVGLPNEYWGPLTFVDSAYNMGSSIAGLDFIAHTSSSLTVDFFAPIQGGSDESWAIDNFQIGLHVSTVPEPATIFLFGFSLMGLLFYQKFSKNKNH